MIFKPCLPLLRCAGKGSVDHTHPARQGLPSWSALSQWGNWGMGLGKSHFMKEQSRAWLWRVLFEDKSRGRLLGKEPGRGSPASPLGPGSPAAPHSRPWGRGGREDGGDGPPAPAGSSASPSAGAAPGGPQRGGAQGDERAAPAEGCGPGAEYWVQTGTRQVPL